MVAALFADLVLAATTAPVTRTQMEIGMDPNDLKSIRLFDSLRASERTALAKWLDVVDLPAQTVLAEESKLAYEFLVIREGTAEVLQGGRHIRDLGPGDHLGEIALLQDDRRRTATVVTTSPVQALVMGGPQFRAMMRELPAVAERIRQTIRERMGAET